MKVSFGDCGGSDAHAKRGARVSQDPMRLDDQMISALLDLAPDAIFARDGERRIIYWSKGAEATYGWSREEAIGRLTPELLRTEYPIPLDQLEQALLENGSWEGDLVQTTKDNRRLVVESRWTVSVDEDGKAARLLEFNRDITARLRAEADRETLRREAERQRLQSGLMRAQHMESLGQLAGGIAHDFNNLLAVILNYASFVAEGLAGIGEDRARPATVTQMREDIEEVHAAGKRAAHLTRQLLAFARREEVAPKLLDPNALVSSVERMLRRTLGEHVTLETSLAGDIPPVLFDPSRFEQVLVNLAVNARDAMPDGGVLRIDTADVDISAEIAALSPRLDPGLHVRLRVSDTGSGMDDETAKRAFEPFFTTKPQGEGTGLGLATTYGVIEQAGGHIEINSEPGMGTTFTVLLPAQTERPSRGEDAVDGAEAATEIALTPSLRPATVLLVEDEGALREVTRRVLVRGGHSVIAVDGAELAIREASRHHEAIDVVLSDVIMPHMHAPALLEQLRETHPEARPILMSGFAQPILASGGRIDSHIPLLEKPFSAQTLLDTIAETLSEAR